MADVTITIDGTAMREALEGDSLKAKIRVFVKGAARLSAERVRDDAKSRLHRQLLGTSSGRTESSIVVRADRSGWGWIVDAGNTETPMLPRWIEDGTEQGKPRSHAAAPRPFFYASAKIEEAAHRDRVSAAIGAAISEYGLGDDQRAGARPQSPGGVGML